MEKLPCPSCGGSLTFRSKTTLFTVCSYCRSNIIRKDVDLEKIGSMAELPEDLSPIQIGTTGRYNKSKFYIAGRIIYNWKDGTWNEWYLLFDNGKAGWLSEAQGEFAISFPLTMKTIPFKENLSLGEKITIKDKDFFVSDIKAIRYLGSEGELPFRAESDYRSTVYDFTNNDSLFLTIEFPERGEVNEQSMAFYGKYIELTRLKLHNMRLLEGWV